MKIVVLAGGLSPERNVSLSTGIMVCQALRERGHEAAFVDMFLGLEGYTGDLHELFRAEIPEHLRAVSKQAPDLDALWAERQDKSTSIFGPGVLELCRCAQMVFLALHGACGEDGRVQAAFDLLGIPYTGSGYLGSAIAMDKDLTKRLIADHGVLTPAWKTLTYGKEEIPQLRDSLEIPCVVKVLRSGSSLGVYIVKDQNALEEALEEALRYDSTVMIEQYIKGREFTCGVLEDRALPTVEIVPQVTFYDYESKYQPGATLEICPGRTTPEVEESIRQTALTVHRALGLSVYSRSDFMVADDGGIYFLEVNTLPGMTPTSLVPQEAAAVGLSYGELCERIIAASEQARRK
ncbi:MAG: D-alanine--D-alanine ligase [Firmicutes bacterium]|nr:D-alanine--D-alanine ligase [Bacillota bacterium]